MNRPDVEGILATLKDFQRATVEHVFRRMYLDADATPRFLLADEVGLGKTLVARGVIALAIDHLWDRVDRIDVIYICSNADIARQNIDRLRLSSDQPFTAATRITMLPVQLRDMRTRKLNFVSITPSTSFNMASQLGWYQERLLLYTLLREPWSLRGVGALNVFQGEVANAGWWRYAAAAFERDQPVDDELRRRFVDVVSDPAHAALRADFDALCAAFPSHRYTPSPEERRERRRVIGALRDILARTCLTALEPDLIIMDEFQRFRHLLDINEDNEENRIARELFSYSDAYTKARVLLVSATPYAMYTVRPDREGDHYEDFLFTYRFLANSEERRRALSALLDRYRRHLTAVHDDGLAALREVKTRIEEELRKYIVRTERLATGTDRNGMLRTIPPQGLQLKPEDLRSYMLMERIAGLVGGSNSVEYWKSAPYLLNFMDRYDIAARFDRAIAGPAQSALRHELVRHDSSVLMQTAIDRYEQLDPANARLRALMSDVLACGAWKLLWIPPSRPWYHPGGVFAEPAVRDFTKRLVFSAWNVVPKVIAVLLSYEVERRLAHLQSKWLTNTAQHRKRRKGPLRFAVRSGRETGMPALALTWPSAVLAAIGDPREIAGGFARATTGTSAMADSGDGSAPLPSLEHVQTVLRERITAALHPLESLVETGRPEDEAWYWAAPLLLDLHASAGVDEWLALPRLAAEWSGRDTVALDDDDEWRWDDHVERVRKTARMYREGTLRLGAMPDDLPEVLALLALGSPATTALRALSRVVESTHVTRDEEAPLFLARLTRAARIGWSFLTLFNLPESISLVRGLNRAEPYWRRVLEYCVDGNLQAVLDEYVHMLADMGSIRADAPVAALEKLGDSICAVVAMRTARVTVHDAWKRGTGGRSEHLENIGRMRFALRLQNTKDDMVDGATRMDTVRQAFNSPFWPFVLATTSIGQEGLDFHAYCHAVVHWNLPTNPVDMEQREGRVHRYKGHAIRRNVARRHAHASWDDGADAWEAMFRDAAARRGEPASDMVPYWVYPVEGGAVIERHVPALPLSSDAVRLHDLSRSMAVYRMVFGQSRQQDLLEYLIAHLPADRIDDAAAALRIDLSPCTGLPSSPGSRT